MELTFLHSEWPNFCGVLAILSAIGLEKTYYFTMKIYVLAP